MFNVRAILYLSLLGLTTITGATLHSTPAIAAPTITATAAKPQPVRVFFPKNPEQRNNMSYVAPVWRQARNSAVAQFAIAQVIAGPTPQEKRLGFMTPINLRGASNCGKDFNLAIAANTAKLQFCRQIVSGGVGDDARVISSITTTLKQFPTIRSVVILDQKGNCFGDMSGENRCLRR